MFVALEDISLSPSALSNKENGRKNNCSRERGNLLTRDVIQL